MRIRTQNLYFQKMPARIRSYTAFWSIAVWICIACSHNIPDASEQISQRPLHHLPDGHFRNTDTLTEPIRDTMEIDSLVPTHRTVLQLKKHMSILAMWGIQLKQNMAAFEYQKWKTVPSLSWIL